MSCARLRYHLTTKGETKEVENAAIKTSYWTNRNVLRCREKCSWWSHQHCFFLAARYLINLAQEFLSRSKKTFLVEKNARDKKKKNKEKLLRQEKLVSLIYQKHLGIRNHFFGSFFFGELPRARSDSSASQLGTQFTGDKTNIEMRISRSS